MTPLPESPYGRIFVVSGPSGVGKDSILDCVYGRLPKIARSVSWTTRDRRDKEADGIDYHFVSKYRFEEDVRNGLFLEHAQYGHDYYGTPRENVNWLRSQGIDVVLKIEVQGARIVREAVRDAVLVFIVPPSIPELERRLRDRGDDTEAAIARRLERAKVELKSVSSYDYAIVNDDLDEAADALCAIVVAERHRVRTPFMGQR